MDYVHGFQPHGCEDDANVSKGLGVVLTSQMAWVWSWLIEFQGFRLNSCVEQAQTPDKKGDSRITSYTSRVILYIWVLFCLGKSLLYCVWVSFSHETERLNLLMQWCGSTWSFNGWWKCFRIQVSLELKNRCAPVAELHCSPACSIESVDACWNLNWIEARLLSYGQIEDNQLFWLFALWFWGVSCWYSSLQKAKSFFFLFDRTEQ